MPIRERGSGYEVSASYKGKRRRLSFSGPLSGAKALEQEMLLELKAEVNGDPGEKLTLAKLVAYCEEYRWVHASTIRQKRSFAKRLVSALGEDFLLIKWNRRAADRVAKSFREASWSQSTVRNALVFLKGMLAVGRELGCAIADVKLDVPPARYRDRVVSADEEKLILSAWAENEYLVNAVVVFLDCGLRVNELLTLQWADIDFEAREILLRETKNGGSRVVGYTSRVQEIFTRMMGENPAGPFVGRNGRRFGDMWRSWKSKLPEPLKSDAQFVPHCLRHTFATRLAKRGLSLPDLQAVLGHSTPQMTLRYAHADADAPKTAADLLEQ